MHKHSFDRFEPSSNGECELNMYKNLHDLKFDSIFSQNIVFYIYKKNCETFCHTETLLIHTLKYLPSVSGCFTKEKKEGRV